MRGVGWDSTAEHEKDLIKRKAHELEHQNKELKQFSYIASHDLQGPLKTVRSFVKLLERDYHEILDPKAQKYFGFITEAVERMQIRIKDLLDFSLIGQNQNLTQVDCNLLLKDLRADLAESISRSKCILTVSDLPMVKAYKTELTLLFQNLISNSIKFSMKGIRPVIRISFSREKNHWKFWIKDNGIGIEKAYQDRIFMIFQRLHTQKEYKGMGIGLAHCKKIVELHHGKIWVESEPNMGSTFYFTIPY
jgi:light-regulated signal transduction histidine kinase (bacteriophytochrome)